MFGVRCLVKTGQGGEEAVMDTKQRIECSLRIGMVVQSLMGAFNARDPLVLKLTMKHAIERMAELSEVIDSL